MSINIIAQEILKRIPRRILKRIPARLRLLPDFIIIGAMKSGTTDLFRYLGKHPDIFPSYVKEPALFLDHGDEVVDWSPDWEWGSRNQIKRGLSNTQLIDLMLTGWNGQKLIGEASTHYTKAPRVGLEAPSNIFAANPRMKLIYSVRNPLDRIVSHYLHDLRMIASFDGEHPFIHVDSLGSYLKNYEQNYLPLSLYFYQISHYLEYFQANQVMITIFEDYVRNPSCVLRNIFDFLEVDSTRKIDERFRIIHKSKLRDKIPPDGLKFSKENFSRLVGPIKEDISRLEIFLGRSLEMWDLSEERWLKNT